MNDIFDTLGYLFGIPVYLGLLVICAGIGYAVLQKIGLIAEGAKFSYIHLIISLVLGLVIVYGFLQLYLSIFPTRYPEEYQIMRR